MKTTKEILIEKAKARQELHSSGDYTRDIPGIGVMQCNKYVDEYNSILKECDNGVSDYAMCTYTEFLDLKLQEQKSAKKWLKFKNPWSQA